MGKKRLFVILLVLAVVVFLLVRATSVFASWHIDDVQEIRAYRIHWDDLGSKGRILREDDSLEPSRLPLDGVVLNDHQKQKLKRALYGLRIPREGAACFYPHHSFVFYNSREEIVGTVDVCFVCDRFTGSPTGFSRTFDLNALKELFVELGMPIANEDWGLVR